MVVDGLGLDSIERGVLNLTSFQGGVGVYGDDVSLFGLILRGGRH